MIDTSHLMRLEFKQVGHQTPKTKGDRALPSTASRESPLPTQQMESSPMISTTTDKIYLAEPEALSSANTIAVRVVGVPFRLNYASYDRALNGDFQPASRDFDILMVNRSGIGDRALALVQANWPECISIAWLPVGTCF